MIRAVTGPPAPKKPPYVHQAYPKMKYHRVHNPVVVKDAAEEQKLGTEWADKQFPPEPSPAALAAPPCARCEALSQKFEASYRELQAKLDKAEADYRNLFDEYSQFVDQQPEAAPAIPSLSDLLASA